MQLPDFVGKIKKVELAKHKNAFPEKFEFLEIEPLCTEPSLSCNCLVPGTHRSVVHSLTCLHVDVTVCAYMVVMRCTVVYTDYGTLIYPVHASETTTD